MFICSCGGILLVKNIEEYPANLTGEEKLTYKRKCQVECNDCGCITDNQSYDSYNDH